MTSHIRAARPIALIAAVAIATIGAPAPGAATDASTGPSIGTGEPQELTLSATEYAFDWPDAVPAGLTRISFVDEGSELHHGQLARLNDGVTPEQVTSVLPQLEADPGPLFSMVTLVGGPGVTAPGGTTQVILDLAAGTYVWFCVVPAADGVPHLAKGMVRFFDVTPATSPATAVAPQADGTVTLTDFTFDLPDTIVSGPHVWEVANEGSQPHELLVVQLQPGTTAMDFANAMSDPSGPPPGLPVGGMQAVAPGIPTWSVLDLRPGTYGVLCFLPDPASGQPHVALGMVSEFSVD